MKSQTSKIKIYPQIITPELADKYLQKNLGLSHGADVRNRKLSETNINFLCNQMKKGEWMITGDPIKFSDKGNLIDGQHTLMAIKKYGNPIEIFVAEGLDESVFSVLDTGKNRSAADVLSMMGYNYATNLASAAKTIILFRDGVYTHGKNGKTSNATNQAILKFVSKNTELQEATIYIINDIYKKFRFINTSALTALYWILCQKNQSKCDTFFEKYANGVDLSEGSPIRLLREKLLKDSNNRLKMTTRDKMAIFIMAWNAYLTNKKITSLSLSKNYDFPKPI